MQELQPTIDYIAILRRRIHWLIWPALVIFLAAAAVALFLPNVYKSEATILIESQQVTANLVPSTVTTYADQRIQAINQEVVSRSNILALVQKFDLHPELRQKVSTEALVKKVKESIQVTPVAAEVKTTRSDRPRLVTIAFTISYEGKDPLKTQGVVSDLTSFFLAKNLEARQASVKGTTDFLEKQVEKVRRTVAELDTEMAKFKEAHLEELPEFMAINMKKAETINDRINNIDREILVLKEQRISVKYKLAFVNPYSGQGSRVLTDEERLQELELRRTELKSKYSEEHPKVKALEKEIDMLKKMAKHFKDLNQNQKKNRLGELEQNLAQLQSKYSEKHPLVKKVEVEIDELQNDIKTTESNRGDDTETGRVNVRDVTNPAYTNLQSEFDGINMRLKSLKNEKKRLLEEEKKIYAKLRTMPDVEKRYNDLLLDRENAKQHLNELQRKLQVATVAQGIEEGQLGENFTIVEPAFLPEEPHKPNRIAIMFLGLILGLGASVGMASLREYSDHSVRLPEEIERLTGQAVLATISNIRTPKERRKKMLKLISVPVVISAVLVTGTALFHYLIMDLYIFYDKLSKFLGDRFFIHF